MGGRSKDRQDLTNDSFAWLKDVSDARLERYGRAGLRRHLEGAEKPSKRTGRFIAVWDNAALEYQRRHGSIPDWSPVHTHK